MLILAFVLSLSADTLRIRPVSQPPVIVTPADFASLGEPSLQLDRGTALWLLGDSASVYLVARLADSTPDWNDRFIVALDTGGDASAAPDHDDFEWDFHRLADSSVIYRGRDGHWQPPRDDPDWRLGRSREGGGWSVREKEMLGGWVLLIQFDREYFSARTAAGLGLAWFDAGARRWVAWPTRSPVTAPSALPDHPMWWGRVSPVLP